MALNRIKQASLIAAGAAVLTLGMGHAAQAINLDIVAETSGLDSGLDRVLGFNSFFKVGFNASDDANAYIESVTFDLSGDTDAAFDNQDFFFFDAGPQVGQVGGSLTAAAISFSEVTRNSFANAANWTRALTVSFAANTFKVGSFFTFGVDTNGVGDDAFPFLSILNGLTGDNVATFNDTGADFGRAGVQFVANIVHGSTTSTGSGAFATTGLFSSQAQITNAPEPLTILGSALALGFGARLKKKRDQQRLKAEVA